MRNKKIIYILIGGVILIGVAVIFMIWSSSEYPPRHRPSFVGILSNISQIKTVAEKVYSKEGSYENLPFHRYTKIIFDDIYSLSGYEVTIHVSKDQYCVYTKLTGFEENSYVCIETDKDYIITDSNPGDINYCDGETFVCPTERKD